MIAENEYVPAAGILHGWSDVSDACISRPIKDPELHWYRGQHIFRRLFLSRQVILYLSTDAESFFASFIQRRVTRRTSRALSMLWASAIKWDLKQSAAFSGPYSTYQITESLWRNSFLFPSHACSCTASRTRLSYLQYIAAKGVEIAEIPYCGHFPMYSNPVEMWRRIAQLLARSNSWKGQKYYIWLDGILPSLVVELTQSWHVVSLQIAKSRCIALCRKESGRAVELISSLPNREPAKDIEDTTTCETDWTGFHEIVFDRIKPPDVAGMDHTVRHEPSGHQVHCAIYINIFFIINHQPMNSLCNTLLRDVESTG